MSFLDQLKKAKSPSIPQQAINLGPGDHYIILTIPAGTEGLNVIASEHTDPLSIVAMLVGGLNMIYAKVLEAHPPEDKRILPPPPGTVIPQ